MSQERNEKEIGSAGSCTGENPPTYECCGCGLWHCTMEDHAAASAHLEAVEARCVRAEEARDRLRLFAESATRSPDRAIAKLARAVLAAVPEKDRP